MGKIKHNFSIDWPLKVVALALKSIEITCTKTRMKRMTETHPKIGLINSVLYPLSLNILYSYSFSRVHNNDVWTLSHSKAEFPCH